MRTRREVRGARRGRSAPPYISAAMGLMLSGVAAGAVTPTWNSGLSSISATHDAGSPEPTGSPYSNSIAIGSGAAALTSPFAPHTISFPSVSPTGTTTAFGGMSHSESTVTAKVVFPAGMGVTQTDPGNVQAESTFGFNFSSSWDVPLGQTFGPTITGGFSVPIGAKVSAGGGAHMSFDIRWDMIVNGVTHTDVRPEFAGAVFYGTVGATTYTGPGSFLTSFTTPNIAFSPSSDMATSGVNRIIIHGAFFFAANNDTGPTQIGIPNTQDFPELKDPASPFYTANPNYPYIFNPNNPVDPTASSDLGADQSPEPSTALLFIGAATLLMARPYTKPRPLTLAR